MRLKGSELRSILVTISRHTKGLPCQVYLFGSRADDAKLGGDIDLLIVADEPLKSSLLERKGRLKSDLSQSLNDQRVDVTVASSEDLVRDDFLKSIFPGAVSLGQ
ncbi:MAG: hypothetical protein C5B49_11655 [Bdellovibrio sp.]|nr:MAG: hypothetical protein C5B49_11655 [Bdellovibrio sp.]